VEGIGVGSREVLFGRASGIQFCCQRIDNSKPFSEIMGIKVIIIFSAHVIAFGK
jgi:hypothetical protein